NIYRIASADHVFATYNYFREWSLQRKSGRIWPLIEALKPAEAGPARLLSIGIGGGRLLDDYPPHFEITGVEICRQVVDFFKRHPEYNRRLFERIRVLAKDGRSVLD